MAVCAAPRVCSRSLGLLLVGLGAAACADAGAPTPRGPADLDRDNPTANGGAASAPDVGPTLTRLRSLQGRERAEFLEQQGRALRTAPATAREVFAALETLPAAERTHAIDLLAALGVAAVPTLHDVLRQAVPLVAERSMAADARGPVLVALSAANRMGGTAAATLETVRLLSQGADPAVASVADQALRRISGDASDPRFQDPPGVDEPGK